jgi:hypothetical protein
VIVEAKIPVVTYVIDHHRSAAKFLVKAPLHMLGAAGYSLETYADKRR